MKKLIQTLKARISVITWQIQLIFETGDALTLWKFPQALDA